MIAAAQRRAAVFVAMWLLSYTIANILAALNVAALVVISAYALHQGVLALLYLRYKLVRASACMSSPARSAATRTPRVTVQLPLYNERYVVERVIAAACDLDYPRDRLQIQVLDDSTDDTTSISQRAVSAAQAKGSHIELVQRDHRDGYKAGALANGMLTATGEFIAIFDADFIPPPDFLRRIFRDSCAFDDPRTAFVQTRWGYLNRDESMLTRAQAMLLDMHFVVDQTARSQFGLTMGFNGSGGVWRRSAIDAAGGWSGDTLTEDLDLSYRAQLKGWQGAYLTDTVCPGELPETLLAFKGQQARWARGSAQCLRKLIGPLMRSAFPLWRKAGALMHLSGYFVSLCVLLVAVISPLLMMNADHLRLTPGWVSALSVVAIAPMCAMGISQAVQRRTGRFFINLPITFLLGFGVSLSNSVAVLSGLFDKASGEFVRTPKQDRMEPHQSIYKLRLDWTLYAEVVLAAYLLVMSVVLAMQGAWVSLTPLLLYAAGFCYVALGQVMACRRNAPHITT